MATSSITANFAIRDEKEAKAFISALLSKSRSMVPPARMQFGIKSADALHLACAESAGCDWFFTTDRGILKKVQNIGLMRVANPIAYVQEDMI